MADNLMRGRKPPIGRTSSREDEAHESRIYAERGKNERFVVSPDNMDGRTQEAESISEQASIGREQPGAMYPESEAGDKSRLHGQGFGSGTKGSYEASDKKSRREGTGQRPLDRGEEITSLGL